MSLCFCVFLRLFIIFLMLGSEFDYPLVHRPLCFVLMKSLKNLPYGDVTYEFVKDRFIFV